MAETLNLLLFLLLSVLLFTGPGVVLLKKSRLDLTRQELVILGTVCGFAAFNLFSYFIFLLKLPSLLAFLFAGLNFPLLRLPALFKKPVPQQGDNWIKIALIFALGILGQLAVIAPSGMLVNGSLVFYSALGHDGIWHIALIEQLRNGFPFQNPVFAGEGLVNYHFFSDIAPAVFSNLSVLSPFDLHFRYFPLLFSLLLGCLAFLIGKNLGKDNSAGIWSVVFTYFAGSFGYIVTYLQNRTIGGESIFWSSQVHSSSGNPPQLCAFVILLAFFYLFPHFLSHRKNLILFTICALLAGSLIVYKVYGGVVLLGALGLVGLIQIIRQRRWEIAALFSTSTLLSLGLYLPNTSQTAGFLIFEPWWFIRTMVVVPDRLNWLDMELRRQTYIFEGNWKRVIQLEGTAFLIFLFGNLGMRFIGFWTFGKIIKDCLNNYFTQLFVLSIFISLLMPMLFLQKGVAGNTSQFLQYFLLFFGILSGVTVAQLLAKIPSGFVKKIAATIIIMLTVPTQVALIYGFYNHPPLARIDAREMTVLKYLKEEIPGRVVILTPPFEKYPASQDTPRIWNWSDTSYVAALSGKTVYFADSEQNTIMGYEVSGRKQFQKTAFSETDPLIFTQQLRQNGIDYLYFPKMLRPKVDLNKTTLTPVYFNDQAEIWKTN